MSNGEGERLPEDTTDDTIDAVDAPAVKTKGRAVKTKTKKSKKAAKKHAEKAAALKPTAKSSPAKSPASKVATSKRSERTTSGYVRVVIGNSDMFVSSDTAAALKNKDLKRLRAVFKRLSKRAQKSTARKKR
jgi:cell division septation protein DedD